LTLRNCITLNISFIPPPPWGYPCCTK
jgi:hypothetical protein